MLDWFDNQQQLLADTIDPTTNNVGHFIKEIYGFPKGFASGGLANDNSLSVDNESTNLALLQRIANEAKASTTAADTAASGGRFGDTATGSGFYNSPAYMMQHYSQLGKFFSGSDHGSKYTDNYRTPQKMPAPTSEDPTTFYANWYNRMREFAEAAEVIGTGQAEVRTR